MKYIRVRGISSEGKRTQYVGVVDAATDAEAIAKILDEINESPNLDADPWTAGDEYKTFELITSIEVECH